MKMKHIKPMLLLFAIIFASCSTEVIDVEVPYKGPTFVIEASLDWEKGTVGNHQTIKLSILRPYFDPSNPIPALGAAVKVTNNEDGTEFIFNDENDGNYTTDSFIPHLNQSYSLEVIYENETYRATETLMPVPDILEVSQSIENDVIEIKFVFQDPEQEENYYLVKYFQRGDLFPFLDYESDEFTNGNLIDDTFAKEDNPDENEVPLVPGDVVDISLYGISEQYFKYMRLLIEQSDGGSSNPFSPIPVELKGNCYNATNPDNYPFGYFRVTQVDRETYEVQ